MDINLLPPDFRNNKGENIKDFTYQNTGYKNTRLNKRILNVDSGILNETPLPYKLTLQEKFKIDKKSDIYLDSFTTFNSLANNDSNKIGFLLSIDEFNNNNSFSNTPNIHNKIFIPNDATTDGLTVTHKGKKLNYIGTINPIEITELNITLTTLNAITTDIFPTGQSRFLMELIFIENE